MVRIQVNLIYQCWTGPERSGWLASKANIEAYAKRIGADYIFDRDPHIADKVCDVPVYFEWLNPMLDSRFWEYDNVAILDMDVFSVEGLTENIFEQYIGDVAVCTEPFQPKYRQGLTGPICSANDERWARVLHDKWGVQLPRVNGLLKVYNAGVVVFSREGLLKAKKQFLPFQKYISGMRDAGLPRFYCIDQNYFHAQMMGLNYVEMHNSWNSYVHYVGSPDEKPRPVNDTRTKDTRLVHIQLRGADDYDAETLSRITNLEQREWGI